MVASTFATSSIFVEDYGPRDGTPIDRIQIHHGAATSLSVMLDLQRPGGHPMNYANGRFPLTGFKLIAKGIERLTTTRLNPHHDSLGGGLVIPQTF